MTNEFEMCWAELECLQDRQREQERREILEMLEPTTEAITQPLGELAFLGPLDPRTGHIDMDQFAAHDDPLIAQLTQMQQQMAALIARGQALATQQQQAIEARQRAQREQQTD